MADKQGLNPQVAEVVTQVLGEWSLEQAATHLNYRLSRTPIADLKRGKVGREETVRAFAEGLWERFIPHFAADIRARFGDCTCETVSDWFAEKAGFGVRYSAKAQPQELTYDPDADLPARLHANDGGEFSEHDLGLFREFLAWQRDRTRRRS